MKIIFCILVSVFLVSCAGQQPVKPVGVKKVVQKKYPPKKLTRLKKIPSVVVKKQPKKIKPSVAHQISVSRPETKKRHQKIGHSSMAVMALIETARQERKRGRLNSSAATLERAVRISRYNALVWYELALVRMKQGQSSLALTLARKSKSLAKSDTQLKQKISRMIEKIKRT
ncbi:MAG: hypothetical protein HON94_03745 [Methylococcales bacterium]|nr:hypothetical protein [Methylococcales bacterium]MBT7410162.1 hypothetical protein [Methylococcales bacterium]